MNSASSVMLSTMVVAGLLLGLCAGAGAQVTMLHDCDSLDGFSGGVLVDDPVQQGTGAISWDNGQYTSLTWTPAAPLDLTGYDQIRFWLHANHPHALGGRVLVYLGSENPATDGADYYHAQLPIDFSGWRLVEMDRTALSPSRSPRGWDQIDDFSLKASGWDNTPDETLVLTLDALAGEKLTAPRTSDEELLEALDTTRPGLEDVATAVAEGEIEAAKSALCVYMRARTEPTWSIDPHNPDPDVGYSESSAENTVAGTFTIAGYTYTFPGGVVDWSYNPTLDDPEAPDNHEWQWQLCRMGFWPNLGRAWWATSDERYASRFAEHLAGFVTTRPMPSQAANGAGSSWRTIEAGIRMTHSWPDAWHYFLHADEHFDDGHMILMIKSLLEHGRYLHEHQTSANWLTHEMGGLYTVGALFPEFIEASDWRDFAVDTMIAAMDEQFLDDGGQYELTPHYHRITIDYMLGLYHTAQQTGWQDELPSGYLEPLRAAYLWLIAIATPSLDVPQINDCTNEDVARHAATALEVFPGEPDFAWAAAGGQGTPPAVTSLHLPDSGLVIMRTGWETDDHYALFDAGPLSRGHSHQDKLQLLFYPYGRRLLFDNGGGTYEASIYRTYGLATASHNTVLVDGTGQNRSRSDADPLGWGDPATPLPVFTNQTGWDYAQASYQDAYGEDHPARHRREVLFLRPDFLLVVDTLFPQDAASHAYQARWHLLTTDWTEQAQRGAVVTTDAGQPNLVVQPLNPSGLGLRADSGVSSPEVLGWDLLHSGGRTPALTVRHDRQGDGIQRFVTLLWPLAPGASDPVIGVDEQSDRLFEVSFDDGSTLLVELPFAPEPGIRVVYQAAGQDPLEVLADPDNLAENEEPDPDGGLDGGPDGGLDGGPDGGADNGSDAGHDAGDTTGQDGDPATADPGSDNSPGDRNNNSGVQGGCGCASPGARNASVALWLLGVLLLHLRRRCLGLPTER